MPKVKPLYSTINPHAGKASHFVIEVPDDFVLIVDTREQDPLFVTHGSIGKKDYSGDLLIARETLPIGDYSIRGFQGEIAVERKSIPDLYGSLFSEWDRFKVELEKMSHLRCKWLVIEGLESDVLRFQDFSKINPNSVRGRLAEIEIRLNVILYYADGRLEAERFILHRLTRFLRLKRDGSI